MHVDDESQKSSSKKVDDSSRLNDDLDSRCFGSLADRAIVVTGPTATGKSSLAIELAERIDADIISLDSITVYRHMDIGTAKPTAEDQRRVRHHMIDVVEPDQTFSVACYLESVHRLLDELDRQGKNAIFVGGTPMYLKGIMRGFDPGPPADWEFRDSVENDLALHGVDALRARLLQVDPLAAHRIDRNDTRRMIRALEVAKHTGIPLSHRQTQFEQQIPADQCRAFVLQIPRDQLHCRINRRVEEMFEAGLVDEVRGLLKRYTSLSRTASQAVGYCEVIEWLQTGGELTETKQSVATNTRRLARRQETWFRSFSELTKIEIDDGYDVAKIADEIATTL